MKKHAVLKNKKAQSVIEYVLVFGAILLAVLGTDLIGGMRNAFKQYFNYASNTIVTGVAKPQPPPAVPNGGN